MQEVYQIDWIRIQIQGVLKSRNSKFDRFEKVVSTKVFLLKTIFVVCQEIPGQAFSVQYCFT